MMQKKINLAELGQEIERLFKEGYNDDDIAKELEVKPLQVAQVRGLLGLERRTVVSVFEKSKALTKNNATETFLVQFSIPDNILASLGMRWESDYEYFASTDGKKKIVINFLERD